MPHIRECWSTYLSIFFPFFSLRNNDIMTVEVEGAIKVYRLWESGP